MIDIINLSIQFSSEYLFKEVDFKINKNDKIALVGSNGTGKTTLLKLIYGIQSPENGKIIKQKNIRLGYLPQEFISIKSNTLFNEVKHSIPEIKLIEQEEREINEELRSSDGITDRTKLLEKQGELNILKEKIGYYEIDSKIEKVLIGLGFKGEDFNRNTREFSGGWQMRIELAKILLSNNDILLLDEPTNHLDLDSLEWVIEYLKEFKGAIILVSHDRHFVNNITQKTLEIFNKKISFYKGNYSQYIHYKLEREEQLITDFKNQQKKIRNTKRFVERFRYKASKASQVQSRVKQLEKIEEAIIPESEKRIKVKIPQPDRSGIIPIEIINLSKSFDNKIVFKNVTLQIERGDKIALVGPNGSGKTTLAKIIAHKIKPDDGKSFIKIGHNTLIGYFAQEASEELIGDYNLLETLAATSPEYTQEHLRSILGAFLFSSDDVFKKVEVLSGGEKSRLALAKLLITKSNLLVLDEPTNHLDFYSKEILQEALIEYSGTIVIVSHDVDFLSPVINKVIDMRNQSVDLYYGGIEYFLAKKKQTEYSISDNMKDIESEKNNRKNEKRAQALERQRKFDVINPVKLEIQECESRIELLENEKSQIEEELSSPDIYKDSNRSKEINTNYQEIKHDLEYEYHRWTDLQDKLERIKKEFSN